ncbi:MAG TPA: hypothetical protein PLJ21_02690 [Pseudobdellovibrionaceae bacterium]|nr:hypothetical protein [Pseudobdellovibrionaceae bacterium]
MSVIHLIAEKAKGHCEKIIFEVGKTPHSYYQGQQKSLRDQMFSLAEWNLLIEKNLDVHLRKELHETGIISGGGVFDSVRVHFQFVELGHLKSAIFYFTQSMNLNLVPPSLDLKTLSGGIYVISNSHPFYLNALTFQISEAYQRLGLSLRIFSEYSFAEDWHSLNTQNSKINVLINNSEACLFNSRLNKEVLQSALEASEMGKVVFLLLPIEGVITALQSSLEISKRESPYYGKSRWVNRLKIHISQRVIHVVGNESHVLSEVLPINELVAKMLINDDLDSVIDILDQSPENSGIVGLDQCLLQQLIRRKIDIKKAFELTRNPEKFDQRLKKVGL